MRRPSCRCPRAGRPAAPSRNAARAGAHQLVGVPGAVCVRQPTLAEAGGGYRVDLLRGSGRDGSRRCRLGGATGGLHVAYLGGGEGAGAPDHIRDSGEGVGVLRGKRRSRSIRVRRVGDDRGIGVDAAEGGSSQGVSTVIATGHIHVSGTEPLLADGVVGQGHRGREGQLLPPGAGRPGGSG